MPRFINPNNHSVRLDLGNPTRRSVTIHPYNSPQRVPEGTHRVIELDMEKASMFIPTGVIKAAPANAPAPTFDHLREVEKVRQRAGDGPRHLRADPGEADRRAKALADEKAREAAAIASSKKAEERMGKARELIRNTLQADKACPIDKVSQLVAERFGLADGAAASLVASVQGEIDSGVGADQSDAQATPVRVGEDELPVKGQALTAAPEKPAKPAAAKPAAPSKDKPAK